VVVAAARAVLAAVAGLAGPACAEAVLADRLAEQGGPGAVTDAVGWLIGRGLPRRAVCAGVRCDDGLRLDTGGACETCGFVVADRRSVRRQEAARVDAELPAATDAERRVVYEQRLRHRTGLDVERAAIRGERAAAERPARQAAAPQARAEAEAADQAAQAVRCAECARPDSAGPVRGVREPPYGAAAAWREGAADGCRPSGPAATGRQVAAVQQR
jgi:hypothetical protein